MMGGSVKAQPGTGVFGYEWVGLCRAWVGIREGLAAGCDQ